MRNYLVLLLVFLIPLTAKSQNHSFPEFLKVVDQSLEEMSLPRLRLSYVHNLEQIPEADRRQTQGSQIKILRQQLANFRLEDLELSAQLEWRLLDFELELQEEYLNLSRGFEQNNIQGNGLAGEQNGKAWYAYFIKKWTGTQLDPDSVFQFGLGQIERVHQGMEAIRKATGLSKIEFAKSLEKASFFESKVATLEQIFAERQRKVEKALVGVYPPNSAIPSLSVLQGQDRSLSQVPGYYSSGNFYYNLFDYPFNLRQVDWLFLHEGNPGHHYQSTYAAQLKLPRYRRHLSYLGFQEGWAAYVEEFGAEAGLYESPYDYYGKWEWDLIRSVRVALDVGLNYYGWEEAEALAFWRQHISRQDDIGRREIQRMLRWPAQVLTYKVGAAKILQLRQAEEKRLGSKFDPLSFHKQVLDAGAIPVGLLDFRFTKH